MMAKMTGLLTVGVLLASILIAAAPARAGVQYPWCAMYNGGRFGFSATICSFDTIEQCRATVSGLGGFCQPNSMYPRPEKKAVNHPRKYHQG
jgi:Protein of unknown function (DUF3551)